MSFACLRTSLGATGALTNGGSFTPCMGEVFLEGLNQIFSERAQWHIDRSRLSVPGLGSTPVTTASVYFTMVPSPSTGQVKELPPFSDQVHQPTGRPPDLRPEGVCEPSQSVSPTSTVAPFILADFGRDRVAACV